MAEEQVLDRVVMKCRQIGIALTATFFIHTENNQINIQMVFFSDQFRRFFFIG